MRRNQCSRCAEISVHDTPKSVFTMARNMHFPLPYKILGDSYTEKGMYEDAITAYNKSIDLIGPHPLQLAYMGRSLALSGSRQKAIEIIHHLQTISNSSYVSPTSFAVIYSGLGEEEQAIDLLEESYRDRCNNLVFINVQPVFDNLRSNSRFTDLIQRMGFVSAPLDTGQ